MGFEMIACLLMAVGTVKGAENMDKELEETMYYTAQEGDTVERIAGKFDLWPCDRLYELNNKDGKKRWRIKRVIVFALGASPLLTFAVSPLLRMPIRKRFGTFGVCLRKSGRIRRLTMV